MISDLIILAIPFVIAIIIFMIVHYNTKPEREKRQARKETAQNERQKRLDYYHKYQMIDHQSFWIHINGLPVPEMSECEIWECENCLIFYNGYPYVLDYSKLINIEFMSRSEIKRHYLNNASGAIAGGMMLGALGAVLGGGTKTVTEEEYNYFVAITYKSDGEIKNIFFDVTKPRNAAKPFVKRLKTHIDFSDRGAMEL